eukprot:10395319-Karenia_brevis.AAC.1
MRALGIGSVLPQPAIHHQPSSMTRACKISIHKTPRIQAWALRILILKTSRTKIWALPQLKVVL